MSGGRATVGAKRGQNYAAQAGDVCSIDPAGAWFTSNFVVECKFNKELRFMGLLTGGKTKINEYWSKLKKEAKHYRKHPFLVAKQNGIPPLVFIDKAGLSWLQSEVWRIHPAPTIIAVFPTIGAYMLWWSDFLKVESDYRHVPSPAEVMLQRAAKQVGNYFRTQRDVTARPKRSKPMFRKKKGKPKLRR
jgi:hypothetical protein